jgi:hypothetical protein
MMTKRMISIGNLMTAGALAAMSAACVPPDTEAVEAGGTLTAVRPDRAGQHLFEVEVRFDRAEDEAAARWLLVNLEIIPAREVFGDTSALCDVMLADPPAEIASADDDGGPVLEVKLYPMDGDVAPHEYAWTVTHSVDPRSLRGAPGEPTADGVGVVTQGLTTFWWVEAWQQVTGPTYRCYAFSSTVTMLSGLSGSHYIYRGREGLIQVQAFPAYIGLPSPLFTVDFTLRYYRTKFRMDVLPGLIQVTNVCM